MPLVFDGDNLIVTLTAPTAGVLNIDAEDTYDESKQWFLNRFNRRYPFPFDTAAGDDLTPGIKAGAYYFFRNDLGWRMKTTEENQSVYVSGNLIPRDSSLPILIPTTGAFTVGVFGLQPITQSIQSLLTDIQYASFNNKVTVNGITGVPLIDETTTTPIGTLKDPVDSSTDALTIAINRGFEEIHFQVSDTLDIGPNFSNKKFTGFSRTRTVLTIPAAATVDDCIYEELDITGTLDGNSTLLDCHIGTLTFVNGTTENCGLHGSTITLGGGVQAEFINSHSLVAGGGPGDTPTIDMGGSGQALKMSGQRGGIRLINKTGTDKVSIDMDGGQVIIDDTVIDGDITLRGVGVWSNKDTYAGGVNVVDLLTPTVVDIDGIKQIVRSILNEVR
jgi:hypothetical protein